MISIQHLSREAGAVVPARADDTAALMRVAEAVHAAGYRFVTITPASHAMVNSRSENAQARSLTDVLGWSRPFSKEAIPDHIFELLFAAGILDRDGRLWRSKVRFSTLNGDLFLHSAFPTTARDAVFFGPDTYKFADAIKDCLHRRSAPVRRAADVCAGAGPGGVMIAKGAPGAEVLMLDINPRAVEFATVNAAIAGLPNARAIQSDLLASADGNFDFISAHPPYLIDPSARAYRHGGPAGTELSMAIVRAAAPRLNPGGTLLLLTGVAITAGRDPFLAEASNCLDRAGLEWSYREVDPDVFGEELSNGPYRQADRIALVVLTASREAA
jgi:methylase of polypeptide subunit release factors